jgi:hypothetical protein
MSLFIGIVGLPDVGKSTLFNALTRLGLALPASLTGIASRRRAHSSSGQWSWNASPANRLGGPPPEYPRLWPALTSSEAPELPLLAAARPGAGAGAAVRIWSVWVFAPVSWLAGHSLERSLA